MYFNPKDFGVRMKEARKTKGLTQEKLSELLGVDRLHVNRMENGSKACSIDLLMDISSLLEVSGLGNPKYPSCRSFLRLSVLLLPPARSKFLCNKCLTTMSNRAAALTTDGFSRW